MAERAKQGLRLCANLAEAVPKADLVIEAVPEDMALKVETFHAARASTRPEHALFASNTSALSITEMAAASGRPDRFAGMHFFNPVHVMKLIELIRGLETSRGDDRRPARGRRADGQGDRGGQRGARLRHLAASTP